MPVINPTRLTKPNGDLVVFRWTPVTESDTCAAVSLPYHSDISLSATGTFGTGGDIGVDGAFDPATSPTFAPLDDAGGAVLSITAAGAKAVGPNAYQYQPVINAGTGVSVTIELIAKVP